MSLRDRGKMKWRPASFIPLAFEMTDKMYQDQERLPKPIIDEDQREEFDQIICTAMEFNQAVKFTVWRDGFNEVMSGKVHYVDSIKEELRIEVKPGEFKKVVLGEIIGVNIEN
jgi:hypothetical protein